MTAPSPDTSRRLAKSGAVIALGLAVEAITLTWSHPLSFLVFLFFGAAIVGVGILLYLWALARA